MTSRYRQFLVLVEPGFRVRWLGVVGLAFALSLSEIGSAALVLLFVRFVASPEEAVLPGVLQSAADGMTFASQLSLVAIGLCGLFAVRTFLHVLSVYVQRRTAEGDAARLSARLAESYMAMPYGSAIRRGSAELIRNAHQAPQLLAAQVLTPAARVLSDGMVVLALLLTMVLVAPLPSLVAGAVIGGTAFLLVRAVNPSITRAGIEANQVRARSLAQLQTILGAMRDIRVLDRAGELAAVYRSLRARLARAQYVSDTLTEVPRAVIELVVMSLFVAIAVMVTVFASDPGGALPVLGVFGYVGLRLMPAIQRVSDSINRIRFSTPALQDVVADLGHEQEPPDPPPTSEGLGSWEVVSLEDVRFRYEDTEAWQVDGVSLTIKRGETIGICGPSGAGKSTLVDLLIGLLRPTAGEITMDGRPLAVIGADWRRQMGVVSQAPFIANDTVQANVAFGIERAQVDHNALSLAIEHACLTDVVEGLPEGLQTAVGDGGVLLSGGERQRVAIARALYRDPETLFLDEATSALDVVTEGKVLRHLAERARDRTTVVIAHRLSTLSVCDRVVFMVSGGLVAAGPYLELLERSPAFRSFHEGQVSDDATSDENDARVSHAE